MPTATGEFHIVGWEEKVFEDGHDGRKLTRATVRQSFSGDIQGQGLTEYLMAYRPDGTADFTGLQRIEGKVAGIKGVIVLRLSGQFDGKAARAETIVVSGAGRGALGELEGSGDFQAPLGSIGQYSLDYY
jgi:hypothetical protein